MKIVIFICCLIGALVTQVVNSAIRVLDYAGREVSLSSPAKRIIALSPHIVENLYSAGLGENIVGVVEYSNYPESAKSIPIVGTSSSINIERIIQLKPDLIVAWWTGNGPEIVNRLTALGFPVYVDEPERVQDILHSINEFALLGGNPIQANEITEKWNRDWSQLEKTYASQNKLRVFFQIWDEPLQTLNGKQIISDVIRRCGGENIFEHEKVIAPRVGLESILLKDPHVIISSGINNQRPPWLDNWKRWRTITAVKNNQVFFIPDDLIGRHTLRILDGAKLLCAQLQSAREVALPYDII